MESMLYVGLDAHKGSIVATVLDREGNKIDQTRLGSEDAELKAYLRGLPGPAEVVLEACNVWQHVYDAAASTGAKVTLAHSYKARVISEASLKSDKVDSLALAQLLRLKAVPVAFAPDAPVRELRQVVRDRAFYREQEHSVRNHIYSILLQKGIPYDERILAHRRKRQELRSLHLPEVDRGLEMLASFDAATAELDRKVHEAFMASKEAQLLETIPGIGEFIAVGLVAELCPIGRFSNVERLCSYAGMTPTDHQSGETSYQGHLKVDSNHLVTWLLVEASWAHRRWEKGSDVAKIARRVSRRRGKQKGNIAGAHKLLKIVYAVLKRGTPYTPERPSPGADFARS